MKDFIIPDRDFGTPAAKSKVMVTLNVDGFDVTVPEGTSIMRAAAEAGAKVRRVVGPRSAVECSTATVAERAGAERSPAVAVP